MSTQATPGKTGTVVNSVLIDAPADRVWRVSTEIEHWPEIFQAVLSTRRTVLGDDEIIMEMTVANDFGKNTVRSHRRYDHARFRIDFEMWTLPREIGAMDGNWTIERTDEGSRLDVVHNFVPQDGVQASHEELAGTLYRNTDHVLSEIKNWAESRQDTAIDQSKPPSSSTSDGLEHAWGRRTASNGISAKTFETCELFFSRLVLAGLDWGDITNVLKNITKETTHGDWVDWHRRWSDLGAHYEQRFAEEAAVGHRETARISSQKAAACHHYAEFFFFDDLALKDASRKRVTEVFDRGIPYLREVVRPLTIPYRDVTLPGYLITPRGNGPWPTVVLINGLDSAKEVELFAFARELVARGMAAVVFDGPGQGLLAGHLPMALDFENVVAAVLDVALRLSDVDADRLGIFGVSFGGYLAARAAAAVPGFRACVNLSGGFDHDNYRQINSMVRTDFRFVFDVPDDDVMADICATSLNLRDMPGLSIPLLAIHGELDSIIPMESCERMLSWARGDTELIRYQGERHVATNYFGDFIPRFADWLADRLGVVTP
jgi:dienelactone hydrolase